MKVVFLLAAEVDIQSAYNLLEGFGEGLGDRFITALEDASRQIALFPLSCRLLVEDYRRLAIAAFPLRSFLSCRVWADCGSRCDGPAAKTGNHPPPSARKRLAYHFSL